MADANVVFPGTQPESSASWVMKSSLRMSFIAFFASSCCDDLAAMPTFEPPRNWWLSPPASAGGSAMTPVTSASSGAMLSCAKTR